MKEYTSVRVVIGKPTQALRDRFFPYAIDHACLEQNETRVRTGSLSLNKKEARRLAKYLLKFAAWRDKKDGK